MNYPDWLNLQNNMPGTSNGSAFTTDFAKNVASTGQRKSQGHKSHEDWRKTS
jgi:hypothetical protein